MIPRRWVVVGAVAATLVGVGLVAGRAQPPDLASTKQSEEVRAQRRAFDGAPPVIPHERFGSPCIECHNERGVAVPDVGFSPPSPHAATAGMSLISRCTQCHVFQQTQEIWRANSFAGIAQDLREGERQHPLAPPVMPHLVLMRENCLACHSGPAAREAIRTSHPERVRCRQCHLEQRTTDQFLRRSR